MREGAASPYASARRVLLDALEGLEAHRDAMVLIGAQAVYLRVGEADVAVAPFTTDGDLAIDVLRSPAGQAVAEASRQLLREQFGSPRGVGIEMLRRSVGELADADEYAASCVALTNDLLDELP